jgi:ketosteroid isomerase-like protein
MSQENVEAVKRGIDAINRRDVDALLRELDSKVEWHSAILMGMGGSETVYLGHEGVREWARDFYETLSEFQAEYPEIRDLGDRVLALGHLRARGRGSGAEIESPVASVSEIQDGKGIRIRTFLDHTDALKAAGLSE